MRVIKKISVVNFGLQYVSIINVKINKNIKRNLAIILRNSLKIHPYFRVRE